MRSEHNPLARVPAPRHPAGRGGGALTEVGSQSRWAADPGLASPPPHPGNHLPLRLSLDLVSPG